MNVADIHQTYRQNLPSRRYVINNDPDSRWRAATHLILRSCPSVHMRGQNSRLFQRWCAWCANLGAHIVRRSPHQQTRRRQHHQKPRLVALWSEPDTSRSSGIHHRQGRVERNKIATVGNNSGAARKSLRRWIRRRQGTARQNRRIQELLIRWSQVRIPHGLPRIPKKPTNLRLWAFCIPPTAAHASSPEL